MWGDDDYNVAITYGNGDTDTTTVEDGSYLRLSQITLGYTFPKAWVNKAYISNARIYFTVYNVATITGYDGYDPEVSAANGVATTPGYDSSTYPRSRSFVVGLNVTF